MSTQLHPAAAARTPVPTHPQAGNDEPALDDTDRSALVQGLMSRPAAVSPKYLYDHLGSKLFEAICLLPEYYPTRTEALIMRTNLADIARACGRDTTLIDLGAGNCEKAEKLFPSLRPAHYVAVDISTEFLCNALGRLQSSYPDIAMTALGQDFSQGLTVPDEIPKERRLFFYPGSSLGNFNPEQSRRFLRGLRSQGGADASLLLGVDLVKDSAILNAAYDDALGITSAFNLNLLRNLNRLLGSNFNESDWRHLAYFNKQESRIEMHLEAQRSVKVVWPGGGRQFEPGERIHTENSYKYTPSSLTSMLQDTGWQANHFWTDPAAWFAVVHASAAPRDTDKG